MLRNNAGCGCLRIRAQREIRASVGEITMRLEIFHSEELQGLNSMPNDVRVWGLIYQGE